MLTVPRRFIRYLLTDADSARDLTLDELLTEYCESGEVVIWAAGATVGERRQVGGVTIERVA